MSEIQRSPNSGNLILLGVGILCLLFGFALISTPTTIASMFLGAKSSFGSPVSDADRLKILFVQGGGILALGQGAAIFIVGLVRLVRNGAPRDAMVKPVGR